MTWIWTYWHGKDNSQYLSEESTLQNFIQVSFYLLLTNWGGCVYVCTFKKKKGLERTYQNVCSSCHGGKNVLLTALYFR